MTEPPAPRDSRRIGLVVGASGGIGSAVSIALGRSGFDVILVGRNAEGLAAVAQSIKDDAGSVVGTLPLDLLAGDPVPRLDSWLRDHDVGSIAAFVHCASTSSFGELDSFTEKDWTTAFRLKVVIPVRLVMLLRPYFVNNGGGSVVLMAGVGGIEVTKLHGLGGAVNAAVIHVAKSLALEVGPLGIRVNALSPGRTRTTRSSRLMQLRASEAGLSVAEIEARESAGSALGRPAEPEEVAAVASLLCTSSTSFITGTNIVVDGCQSRAV